MRIELHIDRLTLHGVPAGSVAELRRAVQSELTRALAGMDPGVFTSSSRALQRSRISLPLDAQPRQVGARVAEAVCRAVAEEPR